MSSAREESLIAEAAATLGPGEEVIGAGHFGLADLVVAQAAGLAAGAVLSPDDVLPLGAAVGGFAAVRASAEAQGVTVKLLVAVTAHRIHVLNRDTGGRLDSVVASFDRATAEVEISSLGLSRFLTLTDPASGSWVKLHGSIAWISAQSAGDKVVLGLLSDDSQRH